ncbi:MAG: helix-turn-helix domain-containing protein [Oscillospiraceae bacterium]|nr:helix-turn-helix domain-containing protein [Oscillospiraceae bacterium]
MNQTNNNFDRRLKSVLSASGVERGELARHLGVSVPTVNRWLNGISTPNVYQFREIAYFFGLPYDWFLEDEGSIPDVDDLAAKLGLSTETVGILLELASEGGNEATLEAVDNALCAALAVIDGVFEDLDRFADKVVAEMEGRRSEKG